MKDESAKFRQREEQHRKAYQLQITRNEQLQREKQYEKQLLQRREAASQLRPAKYIEFTNHYSNILCPIRIDVDQDGVKIRDCFTIAVDSELDGVAKSILQDYNCNLGMLNLIKKIINDQIQEFMNINLSLERTIKVKLNITVETTTLQDQFDWFLSQENSPEDFAAVYCADLNLGPEFITAVAHSIREQIHNAKKMFLMNPMDESLFIDTEQVVRNGKEMLENSPYITVTTKEEMEKIERDLERENRRKRRQTQRSRNILSVPETGCSC